MLKALFPKPFPDETIFSLLCRFHLLGASPHFQQYTLPSLGVNTSRPSAEFPSFLPGLSQASGISTNELAKNLTSIHYYEPFITSEDYLIAFNALTSGDTKSLQSKLGSIANRIAPGSSLRYCPQCAKEDSEQYGVAYWHRVHQLVGVTACPFHHSHLVEQRRSKFKVQLPTLFDHTEDGHTEEFLMSGLITDEFFDNSLRLTKGALVPLYLHQLRAYDLTTLSGRIRQRRLQSFLSGKLNVLSKYSPAYRHLFLQSKKECYPQCLFYCPDCNHHPIKHLFLIHALFGSWSEFTDCISQGGASDNKKPLHPEVLARHAEPDWPAALALLRTGASLRSVAAKFSTTISTLKIKAQQKKIVVDTRPQKIFRTEERAIWRKLMLGTKTKTLADEYGVSIGAIEKILSKHPRLKILRARIWYKSDLIHHQYQIDRYCTTHLSATRNEIKRARPASYAWLYAHERSWLYNHLPPEIPRSERYLR